MSMILNSFSKCYLTLYYPYQIDSINKSIVFFKRLLIKASFKLSTDLKNIDFNKKI